MATINNGESGASVRTKLNDDMALMDARTTVGYNVFTLTNPSAVRYLRINADNSVTARTAAEIVSDIGALPTTAVRRISIIFSGSLFNPSDSTSYFFGNIVGVVPNTSSVARFRIEAPATGVLNRVRLNGNFTAGSNQSATWRINNVTAATSVTLTSSFSFAAANNFPAVFTSVGLAVTLGDELELELVCPAWTPTNPTALSLTTTATIDVT